MSRLAGLGIVVVAAAIGWFMQADRNEQGEIVGEGAVAAHEMRLGDCFNLDDPNATEVDDVGGVPCGQPHGYEVFAVFDYPGSDFPGDNALVGYADTNCRGPFADYVGLEWEASRLDFVFFVPMDEGWRQGDHAIACALVDPTGATLPGSMRGSRE